jgi:hypothetical protein
MALLYGRAARLNAENGGLWPAGQGEADLGTAYQQIWWSLCEYERHNQVRNMPSWPRSWANFTLL